MRRPRALDLFCGAGGASMGLHRAGFDVWGVDWVPQPNYPFTFRVKDVRHISVIHGWDFIWASPPCQAYTNAQKIRGREHPDMIAEVRDLLVRSGVPFAIENVVGAPLENPIELCGAMFALKVYRHRLFECSFQIKAPPHPAHTAKLRKMGRPPQEGEFMHVVGNFSGVRQARLAMGIDWMTRDELREAIPPAYSEFIGRAAMSAIVPQRVAAE